MDAFLLFLLIFLRLLLFLFVGDSFCHGDDGLPVI